jgi:hypothetical protein
VYATGGTRIEPLECSVEVSRTTLLGCRQTASKFLVALGAGK